MICEEVDVVAYHFGIVSDDERMTIEEHLFGCRACLRKYLDVKRSIETAEEGPRPSDAARTKLRRAVAIELSARPRGSWWERPVAIAAAACLVLASAGATHALTSGPGSPPYAVEHEKDLGARW